MHEMNQNYLLIQKPANSFQFVEACPACSGAGYFRQDVPTSHPQFGKLIRCEDPFHTEDRLTRLARLSGMMRHELSNRLTAISRVHNTIDGRLVSNVDMLDAARSLIDEPYGFLYIWGPPGNAKTVALQAIVNELNERGKGPAIYNKFVNLMDYIKDAFSQDAGGSYLDRFQQLLSARVLAIDEMDKARLTQWSEEFRSNFLDERYRQAVGGETITIFAGNEDPADLPEAISDRIFCGSFRVVKNTAPTARPNETRKD